jgi:hypothetical protein
MEMKLGITLSLYAARVLPEGLSDVQGRPQSLLVRHRILHDDRLDALLRRSGITTQQ